MVQTALRWKECSTLVSCARGVLIDESGTQGAVIVQTLRFVTYKIEIVLVVNGMQMVRRIFIPYVSDLYR